MVARGARSLDQMSAWSRRSHGHDRAPTADPPRRRFLAILISIGSSVGAGAASASPAAIPNASGPVHVVPVGGELPGEAEVPTGSCRPPRTAPRTSRSTHAGTSPNDENPRVTGNFVGTTDEIIQWAACRWGMDPTWARNQAALESFWIHTTVADFATDPAVCLPGHPIGADGRPDECPEATGLLQVRYQYHLSAFEDNNRSAPPPTTPTTRGRSGAGASRANTPGSTKSNTARAPPTPPATDSAVWASGSPAAGTPTTRSATWNDCPQQEAASRCRRKLPQRPFTDADGSPLRRSPRPSRPDVSVSAGFRTCSARILSRRSI